MELAKKQNDADFIPLTAQELLVNANIQLRLELLQVNSEKLKLENREWERSIADRTGVDLKDWVIDLPKGRLKRK